MAPMEVRMQLRNGVFYKLVDIEAQNLEVLEENIVRDKGMTRHRKTQTTPFQEFLNALTKNNYKIDDETLVKTANELFTIDTDTFDSVRMDSLSDDNIIDAYSDNSKRYFETLFTKKILLTLFSKDSIDLNTLILELTKFITTEYQKSMPNYLKSWQAAKNEKNVIKDESLDFYRNLRPDLLQLIHNQHFGEPQVTLIEWYDLHYLTHGIAKLPSYKTLHPNGILDIYPKDTFFQKPNRGRIANFGLIKNIPSANLGIFRSIDKSTADLRKDTVNTESRCPDRLYMEHPRKSRNNRDSWLYRAFSNGLSQGYVNGLSGSVVLECRLLLFFMLSIESNHYQPQLLKPEKISEHSYALIQQYMLLVLSSFVYFEGGHTINEIMNVLNLRVVKTAVQDVFPKKNYLFSVENLFVRNPNVIQALKESLIETAKFHAQMNAKEKVHEEIVTRFSR
jgi:hypothetical protein